MKKKKPDPAHLETDAILEQLEKRISKEYRQASLDVQRKLNDYLRRFEKKDETWQQWVKEGRRTESEYKQWRIGQIAIGRRWQQLRDNLTEDYHNANEIARSMIDKDKPRVYALNHDYGTYEVEHGTGLDTSYTLYDHSTVERLIRDNPDMLPPPGRKVAQNIAAGLDVRWNNSIIQSVATQSLLQGMAIPEVARNLAQKVGDSNHKAAIRNARTMITAAQNAGRIGSYKRAESMGIKLKKQWLATLDNRTRHQHRLLDGKTVNVDEAFHVEGHSIRYPGDPTAPGYLIYNCRCTLIADLEGFENDVTNINLRHNKNLGNMTYEEWKAEKRSISNPITLPEEKATAIKRKYTREYWSW